MTAVLDASMTENVISFKTLYELKSFPKLQQCENNVVWTESGPINIVAESCPKVLVGQEEGYVNFLVSHDIGHSAILRSTFMGEHHLMGAAHIKPERVEEVSEIMENEEHFQRLEKVGLLTTALLRGSVGIYGITTPHAGKISSDPAKCINGLGTASGEPRLKINEGNGIIGGTKSKCTHTNPETSASPATPNSIASRREPEIPIQSNCEILVGWDSSVPDQADGRHCHMSGEELPSTAQEVEDAMTWKGFEMGDAEPGQLPEEGDVGALDAYIEEPLPELETDEGYEFPSKELDFDVHEVLVDVNTFVEEEHPMAVSNPTTVQDGRFDDDSDDGKIEELLKELEELAKPRERSADDEATIDALLLELELELTCSNKSSR